MCYGEGHFQIDIGISKNPLSKKGKRIPLFDCFKAPCVNNCPIGQNIPKYIALADKKDYIGAFLTILEKNPLPFITGTLCRHSCMLNCIRNYCDEAIHIKDLKLMIAQKAFDEFIKLPNINKQKKSGNKIAVIGSGPAGISVAHFLARNNLDVTVFEKRNELGGMIRHVIPEFRIKNEIIEKDIQLAKYFGVHFEIGREIIFLSDLKNMGYKYIIIATGAWQPKPTKIKDSINALDFLEKFKKTNGNMQLGENIAVMGGGNTSIDVARAAKRLHGTENVYLIYRRAKECMPAEKTEIELALKEGIQILDFLLPTDFQKSNQILLCERMRPDGQPHKRTTPVIKTNEFVSLHIDNLIISIGEKSDERIFFENDINRNNCGETNKLNFCNEIQENIFVAGDVAQGPSTILDTILDARKISSEIMRREKIIPIKNWVTSKSQQVSCVQNKKVHKKNYLTLSEESSRCLQCNLICENCVEVCPNHANIPIKISLSDKRQILHIEKFCSECGNCTRFCPYDASPCKQKFTMFSSEESFDKSNISGFFILDKKNKVIKMRLFDKIFVGNIDDYDVNAYAKEIILQIINHPELAD